MKQWETRFARPERQLAREMVAEALRASGAAVDPRKWEWIEHGSANLIVLAGPVAIRLTRTVHEAQQSMRIQRLVDALPELPFAVPRSLALPVTEAGLVAQAQQRVIGEPHPSGSGEPAQLRRLLESIHGIDLDLCRRDLAAPRSFMGGDGWYDVMTQQAIPMLDRRVQASALRIADRLAQLTNATPAMNHGDLAGANILWANGRVSGVLDWDLAAADDPAEDAAALGVWHGWETLANSVPADVLLRAEAFRDSFPLQLICHAIVADRGVMELERAVSRANERLRNT